MKEKLQSALGGFGVVLYFLLSWLICFYPLLFCGFPWWGDVIYIALIVFLGGTFLSGICSTVIYVIALINVLRSPIDVWSVIFLVLFIVNILYFVLNISTSRKSGKCDVASEAPDEQEVSATTQQEPLETASPSERAYVYATGANGLPVRIPADRLKEWSETQEKLRRGEDVPEARQMAEKLKAELHRKYGTPRD